MTEPRGKHQLTRSTLSPASVEAIWAIMADSTQLPRWAPPVQGVERCDGGGERVGSVRVCRASLGGRVGTIVERVTDLKRMSYITYAVDEDTFGMTKMFANYGFRLSLARQGRHTRITIESFYSPRTFIIAAMNALFMRRQFSGVLDGLLRGLSEAALDAPSAPVPKSP
jgi:hypothetical protein